MGLMCMRRDEGKGKKGWKRGEGGVKKGYVLIVCDDVGSCLYV